MSAARSAPRGTRVAVFAAGTTGDVRPCMALCLGLSRAGFEPLLAASSEFGAEAAERGIPFADLGVDLRSLLSGADGRDATGGASGLRAFLAMRRLVAESAGIMARAALEAARGAELLVSLGAIAPFAFPVADSLGIPLMFLEPAPLMPSRDYLSPSWPARGWPGPAGYAAAGRLGLRATWAWYEPTASRFARSLGLRPEGFRRRLERYAATPAALAYSPSLVPGPSRRGEARRLVGCLRLEEAAGAALPAGLERFLDEGPPPVYIGFGSMGGADPRRLAELALGALDRCGLRGLLVSGWGGLDLAGAAPPEGRPLPGREGRAYILPSAPHSLVFPRVGALVHHGGAGTTHEGLRAGKPTLVVPFAFDQPFWGERVAALGLGPAPLPRRRLDEASLAAALARLVDTSSYGEATRELSRKLQAEDATAKALEQVELALGRPAAPQEAAAAGPETERQTTLTGPEADE